MFVGMQCQDVESREKEATFFFVGLLRASVIVVRNLCVPVWDRQKMPSGGGQTAKRRPEATSHLPPASYTDADRPPTRTTLLARVWTDQVEEGHI